MYGSRPGRDRTLHFPFRFQLVINKVLPSPRMALVDSHQKGSAHLGYQQDNVACKYAGSIGYERE